MTHGEPEEAMVTPGGNPACRCGWMGGPGEPLVAHLAAVTGRRLWTEIEPRDALEIRLPAPDVVGPYNELGEPCPWPWDPPQLKGRPIGQYHCPYCGAMVMAGMDHLDYGPREEQRDVPSDQVEAGGGRVGVDGDLRGSGDRAGEGADVEGSEVQGAAGDQTSPPEEGGTTK